MYLFGLLHSIFKLPQGHTVGRESTRTFSQHLSLPTSSFYLEQTLYSAECSTNANTSSWVGRKTDADNVSVYSHTGFCSRVLPQYEFRLCA